jgi:hypothetical protein
MLGDLDMATQGFDEKYYQNDLTLKHLPVPSSLSNGGPFWYLLG